MQKTCVALYTPISVIDANQNWLLELSVQLLYNTQELNRIEKHETGENYVYKYFIL